MNYNFLKNKNIINNLHSLSGNGLQAAFGFITFLILVRYTEKVVFGQWVIFLTVAGLMDMFRMGLTGMATVRLLAMEKNYTAIGSSYQLSVVATLVSSICFGLFYILSHKLGLFRDYLFIFMYYPMLAFSNIPYYQGTIVAQGESNFFRLSLLKFLNALFILGGVGSYIFLYNKLSLYSLISIYICANGFTSLISFTKGWDGFKFILKGNALIRKSILRFGKYSTAGFISSKLLKSSDTFILGASSQFGPEAVAVFAIPFKFVEMFEIIIRSLNSTAFPKFTKSLKKSFSAFSNNLILYTMLTTLFVIPPVILLCVFPEFFLRLIGGTTYLSDLEIQKYILYVICVYILILPSDRYTGVALLAMDRGKENFLKILYMLGLNIAIDLLAVFVFKSLVLIAFATLLFTFIGLVIGWMYIMDIGQKEYGSSISIKSILFHKDGQIKTWSQLKNILIQH